MGRRALPKLDPVIGLEGFLVPEEVFVPREFRFQDPFASIPETSGRRDWRVLFPRPAATLELEIGSGKGLFLRAAAAAQPLTQFVGIEIAAKYARHIAAKLARQSLDNARIIQGDAHRLFVHALADNCVDATHIYFPDPWWKSRHRRRRLLRAEFIAEIHRVLKPGGALHLWTDVEEYFNASVALIVAHQGFDGPFPVAETVALRDLDYRTHFERRVRRNGLPVYRAEFAKVNRMFQMDTLAS